MALLARVIKQRRIWVELSGILPGDMEFPAGVISDLWGPGGVSFWRVSDRGSEGVRRVVVNWAGERQELEQVMEIRFVDEDAVPALGMSVIAKKGIGPDKGFHAMHRDVVVKTNKDAINLAREMLTLEPVTMLTEEIVACIAE